MEDEILQRIEVMSKLLTIADPPTICAIGAQNVGKSTILNAIMKTSVFPSRRSNDPYNGAKTTMQVTITTYPDPVNSVYIKQGAEERNVHFNDQKEMLDQIYDVLNYRQTDKAVLDKTVDLAHEPVNITIKGPGIPHFHITDTPGIVANDVNKHAATSHIVERSIVGKKNTIILFFINSGDDWANTPGWSLVNRPGVCRENVIVVFTKPDNSPANGKGVYESMHKGLDWVLPENVLVVKGPDTYAGETILFSTEQEISFFKNSTPYFTQLVNECPERVGVSKLSSLLYKRLKNIYLNARPDIIRSLESELEALERSRLTLGEAITQENKNSVLFNSMFKYTNNVSTYMRNNDMFVSCFPVALTGGNLKPEAENLVQRVYKRLETCLKESVPSDTSLDISFWSTLQGLLLKPINTSNVVKEIAGFIVNQSAYIKYSNGGHSNLISAVKLVVPAIVYKGVLEPMSETAFETLINSNYAVLFSSAVEKESNSVKRSIIDQQIKEKRKALNVMSKF